MFADSKIAAEELSEEDQQLKNELDMLVERLTVCLRWMHDSATKSFHTDRQSLGIRCIPLQACPRGNEDLDQDIYELHDRRTEAFEVPQTTLRTSHTALRTMARG